MSLRTKLPFLSPRAEATDEPTSRWLESVVTDAYPADPERIARVRERILLQARVARREAAALRETTPRRPFIPGRLGTGRRAAVLAVGLLVASVGAVAGAESGPGEAFYAARLAVEDVTLPPADTRAGVEARLDSLHRRLAEAAQASRSGDDQGAAAALGAYRSRLARLFHADASGVDLAEIAIPGVDLPAVAARLSQDDGLVRSLEKALGRDHSTATGVIGEMDRIRSAIADRVARDTEARQNAGSGNGLGPRATNPGHGKPSKVKATPAPNQKGKKKRPHLATPSLAAP